MKSCIIHGCEPKTNQCSCEDSVSQADVYERKRIVDEVPTLFGMLPDNCEEGIEADSKGPFIWTERTVRKPGLITQRTISFRRA